MPYEKQGQTHVSVQGNHIGLPLRPVQADVIKVHFAGTAGDCHIASSTETNRYTVNIGQIYALI